MDTILGSCLFLPSDESDQDMEQSSNEKEEEYNQAVRLFKTSTSENRQILTK